MTTPVTSRFAGFFVAALLAGPVFASPPDVPADGAETLLLTQSSRLFGSEPSATMRIDLVPGSDENTVNPRQGRSIEIVVFGTQQLEVGDINPRTLRLSGVDVLLVGKSDKSLCRQQDIDGDGRLDLVCEVRTTGFRVAEGEYKILIEAETYNKASLSGEDRLRVVRD